MGDHSAVSHAVPVLRASDLYLPESHSWRRLPAIGITMAVVGLGGSLALGLGNRPQLWHSWLVAALFALSIALGCLFFVLSQHASQAGWSIVVRRIAENLMAAVPWLGLLFVPLLFGMGELFHWSHAEEVAKDHLLAGKQPYLNVPFFVTRTAFYFAVWSLLAIWLRRTSRRQDASGDHELTRRMRKVSGPGLILFAITTTFAAFDWLMSLDPHWYSTIFGVYFFSGCMIGTFATLALVVLAQWRSGLLRDVISLDHLHDIGKLLFAFVVFWAYIGFSQYFLIWYGNLPEEIGFFGERLHGSWRAVSMVLLVGHFGLPFFYLMSRATKRNRTALAAGAIWLLAMHALDLHWLVMPRLHPEGFAPGVLDALTLIGSTGVLLAAFGWAMRRQALVPLRDPRLPESLTFENI